MSLRVLLFCGLALAAVIPAAAFWLMPATAFVEDRLEREADKHEALAMVLAASLERHHADATAAFRQTVAQLVGDPTRGPGDAPLAEIGFRHICLVDRVSGAAGAAAERSVFPCPDRAPQSRLDMAAALAPTDGALGLSGVSAGLDGAPLIFFIERRGAHYAIGALETTHIVELAESIAFGERGHAAIVDADGRVIAHPLSAWRRERRDLSGLAPVERMKAGAQGVAEFYSPAMEADMIAGHAVAPTPRWGVMVPQPKSELLVQAEALRDGGLAALALGVALAALMGWVLSGLLTRPVRRFAAAVRAFGDAPDKPTHAVAAGGPRELRALGQAIDDMSRHVQQATERERAARERAEAANNAKTDFVVRASHELRTPLSAVIGFAELIESDDSPNKSRRIGYAREIQDSGRRLLRIVNDMIGLSTAQGSSDEAFDLPVAIQAVLDGEGIAPEDIACVFEPFFQSGALLSRRHEGVGLGLAIVKAIIEAHDGIVDISSRPGEGATITASFPISRHITASDASSLAAE